jgi:AbiV family abortive infection protein
MNDEIKIIGVKECLYNSKELLESSKILYENGKFNHSYHLVTLALEEIGKTEIILISQLPPTKESQFNHKKLLDDHIKKLFWAFFGPMFGKDILTKESLESTEGLATKIHNSRIQGLYVDLDEDTISIPQNIDLSEETKKLIDLVETRLDFEIYKNQYVIYKADPEILHWFMAATDVDERRKRIMSHSSMKKLVEFGDVKEWIKWLKKLFDNEDEENKKMLESELNRRTSKKDKKKLKWKIKYRLYSDSHKLKQKELNDWNNYFPYIKLHNIPHKKRKNELLVEIIAPKSIHMSQLFNYCWQIQRYFLIAINIGSSGFFWWDIPKYRNKFYESAYDIENKAPFEMIINPTLKIDWQKGTLDAKELKSVAFCFSQLPKIITDDKLNPTNYYYSGLLFLGQNDLNYRCEREAFTNFYLSVKHLLRYFGTWDGVDNYYDALNTALTGLNLSEDFAEKIFEIGENSINEKEFSEQITLEQVGISKVICDTLFVKFFNSSIDTSAEV